MGINSQQLSLLEERRRQDPRASDADHVTRLASDLLRELQAEPPVDLRMVASAQQVRKIEHARLPCAGCLLLDPTGGYFKIKLRAGDHPLKQRFTGFHEVVHTFMPGCRLATQRRCDPAISQKKLDVEGLCDLGAAEFILPREMVEADLAQADFGLDTVAAISERYDASLQASAHRFVDLWSEPTLLIVLSVRNKPSERNDTTAPPKLRVNYALPHGRWPWVPKHKSVADDDPLQRAVAGERVEAQSSLTGLGIHDDSPLRLSARLYPYRDPEGIRHERVVALYRRVSRTAA